MQRLFIFWIIASVLCFPYYRVSDGEAPVEKMAPRRKCKFNDDWRSHFTWIAKLPDNGMAQCNLCVTDFSISSGGRTDIRRHQESAHHTKGPATRNDIVDFSSSTMAFNVAKIASSARSLTISLTKSLRVAGHLVGSSSKGGMVQCVEICHLGESRPNAGIRHYSDIQCCQRAGLLAWSGRLRPTFDCC